MENFIQHQYELSLKLLETMTKDHEQRIKDLVNWGDISFSLIKKVEERDKEIERLRNEIKYLKGKQNGN